jgi:hypothetical protein
MKTTETCESKQAEMEGKKAEMKVRITYVSPNKRKWRGKKAEMKAMIPYVSPKQAEMEGKEWRKMIGRRVRRAKKDHKIAETSAIRHMVTKRGWNQTKKGQ